MNHITGTTSYPAGTTEADEAERLALQMDEMVSATGTTADGRVTAAGLQALTHAVLALRATVADTVQDAGSAIAELDMTISSGLGDVRTVLEESAGPARGVQGPACTLAWVPDWEDCTTERGGGHWEIRPAASGVDHEALPREFGRRTPVGTLADLAALRLGGEVTMFPRRRLAVAGWRAWLTPVWHVYLTGPARDAGDAVPVSARDRAEARA